MEGAANCIQGKVKFATRKVDKTYKGNRNVFATKESKAYDKRDNVKKGR